MKTLVPILILTSIFILAIPVYAIDTEGYDTVTLSKTKDIPSPFCPATKISDNSKCMDCHALIPDETGKPKFGLQELKTNAGYEDMPYGMSIVFRDGEKLPYYLIGGTDSPGLRKASEYMYRHPEFKKIIIELHTPGGSIMDAWRSIGIMEEMQKKGIVIETRVYGMSASAGVILMVGGTEGHRFVNPHAEIMIHKVWTFSMFDLKNPDTAEDQANTLKHFQTNINNWLVSRSKLTKEKIEECIFKKDFWMTGTEAVEYGLADGFID